MKIMHVSTTAGKVLCCTTGDKNVSRFFVSFQTKLNKMQCL